MVVAKSPKLGAATKETSFMVGSLIPSFISWCSSRREASAAGGRPVRRGGTVLPTTPLHRDETTTGSASTSLLLVSFGGSKAKGTRRRGTETTEVKMSRGGRAVSFQSPNSKKKQSPLHSASSPLLPLTLPQAFRVRITTCRSTSTLLPFTRIIAIHKAAVEAHHPSTSADRRARHETLPIRPRVSFHMQQPPPPTRGRQAAAAAAQRPPPAWHHTADRPFFRPPPPPPPGPSTPPPRAAPTPPRGHRTPDRPTVPTPPPPVSLGHHPPDRPAPAPAPPEPRAPASPASPGRRASADRLLPTPPGRHAAASPAPAPAPEPVPTAAAPAPPPGPYHAYPYHQPELLHAADPLVPPRRRASSALASCLVAAAFLLLAAGGAGAALFLLFRPQPPDIAVAAVRLPSFAAANGTVAFTFEQTAAVRNPNRSPLAHFDSSLRVAYAGGELGSVYIPAGLIDGGRTKDMSASFAVPAFPAATPDVVAASAAAQQPAAAAAAAPVIEVDSLLVVKGRVKVLHVLTHRVQAAKVCRVGVSPLDGTVLGFRC
ncbi:hypothetical protein ACP4OV_020860 [Aristida adscensionis]